MVYTYLINSAEPVDWDDPDIARPDSWEAVADRFWYFTHYWESEEHFGICWEFLNMPLSQTKLTDEITTLALVFHKGYSNYP